MLRHLLVEHSYMRGQSPATNALMLTLKGTFPRILPKKVVQSIALRVTTPCKLEQLLVLEKHAYARYHGVL